MEATFKARARTLDMLGRQQIAGIPTAISELFKNAHDAYAENVEVDYYRREGLFVLRDDGRGMTREQFVDRWLTIATETSVERKHANRPRPKPDGDSRPVLGEKGMVAWRSRRSLHRYWCLLASESGRADPGTRCLWFRTATPACPHRARRAPTSCPPSLDGLAVVPPQERFDAGRHGLVILRLAFPDHHDLPAKIAQRRFVAFIADDVALELVLPVSHARFGAGRALATRMSVPEASMNHDDGLVARENDVGATRKVFAVEAKPEPECVRNLANNQLRPGVSAPNA